MLSRLLSWPSGRQVLQLGALLTLMLFSGAASADAENSRPMHWAFSAFFGTGWYEVSNAESVFVVRAPLKHTWRESAYSDGQGQPGIEFHFPVTLGLHDLDEFNDFIDTENFGTVAFTPGVEFEIPISGKWYLRPLAHFGWGKETDGDDSAWIYYGGIKSRYTPATGKLDWSLLNALYHAGYNSREGGSGSVSTAMVGAEFHHPLAAEYGARGDLQLNWHLTYSWMFDPAQFGLRNDPGNDPGNGASSDPRIGLAQTVDDQWELGLALAPRDRSFKLGFMTFDQLGLSLRSSSSGDFRAIAINVSSPFY